MKNIDLASGVYRHYKGAEYWIERVAKHSETEEEVVVYQALYGDYGWWVRPKEMFLESVEIDGEVIPRFEWLRAELNAE
ncbi:DUF1653 domain-containing protein [Marinomonas piezotolerans]|uniref:DUF1653 domain-containing protein n=1 Tax=Marinomonas piezotolerans TaxID=2213058 RepID=A0A370U8Q6_9GAMM|nr:DUF1653 domain-containing protein [Marinomonas piezotolerans]RDL44123.1 DUF1653 domain-containing protein [Marinomonas piezotolerans]